jgi:metal-responsive CopG/Arc/MetJ family transcriptional regulator
VKVTVSLPAALLAEVDVYQHEHEVTRSEAVAALLQAALAAKREQADIERYIRGYLQYPETEEELRLNARLAAESAARDPWP